MKISIVIPIYNAENTIARLVDKLIAILSQFKLEIILVNDGSTDDSDGECTSIFKKYENNVIYISLAKNFGEHNAVMAGLNNATGDYAVIIDDDFQNPPEEIIKLIDEALSKDYDVVYSYYAKKYHTVLRNLGSRFDNLVASYLLNKPKGFYLSSFKCLSRFVVKEITQYTGPFPYIDGLIWRTTRNIGRVLTEHSARISGRSGYTMRRLVHLWLNMFVNFSILPLRVSTILGLVFSIAGVCSSIYLIIDKILHPNIPMGITSILVGILIFAGIQLLMLGLIGEYLGKLLLADNQTPQYVIRRVYAKDIQQDKA